MHHENTFSLLGNCDKCPAEHETSVVHYSQHSWFVSSTNRNSCAPLHSLPLYIYHNISFLQELGRVFFSSPHWCTFPSFWKNSRQCPIKVSWKTTSCFAALRMTQTFTTRKHIMTFHQEWSFCQEMRLSDTTSRMMGNCMLEAFFSVLPKGVLASEGLATSRRQQTTFPFPTSSNTVRSQVTVSNTSLFSTNTTKSARNKSKRTQRNKATSEPTIHLVTWCKWNPNVRRVPLQKICQIRHLGFRELGREDDVIVVKVFV